MRETRTGDYLEKIYEQFPELDEKGLAKLCHFIMKNIYDYVHNGYDVQVNSKKKDEKMFSGRITVRSNNPEFYNEIAKRRKVKKLKLREELKAMPKAKPGQYFGVNLKLR